VDELVDELLDSLGDVVADLRDEFCLWACGGGGPVPKAVRVTV